MRPALVILVAALATVLTAVLFVSACGSSQPRTTDDAWAVGGNGTICATTDGGAHWVAQHSGTTENLLGLAFADSKHGWAVGEDGSGNSGIILATSDGGAHWVSQLSGHGTAFCSVACSDDAHAWAASQTDARWAVMATSDGGRTWTTQASGGTPLGVPSVVFADARHGWVSGIDRILVTRDGGQHWRTQLAAKANQRFDSLAFCDATHGFVVGADPDRPSLSPAAVWSTSDGGVTWSELPGPPDEMNDLRTVTAVDRNHILVAGDGMWFSTDAGRRWTACTVTANGKTAPAGGGVYNYAFSDSSHGWGAVGGIFATSDGGASWNVQLKDPVNWRNHIRAVACPRR